MISIIIPAFNAGKTLESCLNSLQAQQDVDFEVVVVDGQSTDKTLSILNKYSDRLTNLRCISERDGGIYDAMNKGVALSNGSWLFFMGADDVLAGPSVLKTVSQEMDDSVDLLYGRVLRVSTGRVEGGRCDRHQLLMQNICQQAIFYRRTLLNRVGPYDLKYKICSDWDLNMRCFADGERQRFIDLVISNYSGTGISATQSDLAFLGSRLSSMARLYGASYWSNLFRPARYLFWEDAREYRSQGKWLMATWCYIIFFYHALSSRLGPLMFNCCVVFSRLKRRGI